MRIQVRNRGLLSLVLSLLLVLGMFATCVEPVHADNEDYDLSNFMVAFDEAYRFLDDIETTPYPDYFYIVTTGRVLEPFVEDTAGELLDSDYYTASYCECRFNEEKNEWEKIDENNWLTEFPTEPGVYFCKVEGVAPYYGSYEKLDLIRVQEPQKYEIPTDYKEIDLSDVYADGWYKSVESGEDMGVPCYSYKLPAVDAAPDASLTEDDGGMVLFRDYVSNITSEDIINAVCYQAGLKKTDCLAIPCFGFDPNDPGSSFCFCNV